MANKTVKIRCRNTNTSKEIEIGSTLGEIYNEFGLAIPHGPVSAKVNNKVEGLNYRVYNNKDVEFLNITSNSGMRTYTRSLFFVLVKAVEDLYEDVRIKIEMPVSRGYYCRLIKDAPITLEEVSRIKKRMQEIILQDIPFKRVQCPTDEAITMFTKRGMMSKVRLLKSLGSIYTYYYKLEKTIDYFYGSLLVSTGKITLFDVVKYYDGLLVQIPNMNDPQKLEEIVYQKKLFEVFKEHHKLQNILGVSTVGDFNEACQKGHTTDLINVSEAIQEKQIAHIAEQINKKEEVRMVLISGPSSSGKTTLSKRLSVQLMACGLKPHTLSLDDYFVNREDTPLDQGGEYDFESLYALDIPFFNKQLSLLLEGKEVELPRFNFQTGFREASGKRLKIDQQHILILEGIHALNKELTKEIDDKYKYSIYVSALTTILLDDHNYIPTTDNRLLRRIIRDYKYRGYSAEDTISRWPSVRKGEEKWIFPYQENADAMFNSALLFEIAVIRTQALPLLESVPEKSPVYSEAYRLRKFLHYFWSITDKDLPPTSLLREFLGGSSFQY